MGELISRQDAIEEIARHDTTDGTVKVFSGREVIEMLKDLPSVKPEEVIPHQNYKYLSDYWCECGNHLGKKGEVKYCADCGRKVKWDE